MNEHEFQKALASQGIHVNEHMLGQFRTYTQTLLYWNGKMNLTSITDVGQIYVKHYYDSLTACFFDVDWHTVSTIIDVGPGAGFPSIPIKICFPHLQVTLVDSLKKRTVFLNALADTLRLDHITVLHDRAENIGRNKAYREEFDVALARAVAKLNVLAEYCLPLIKTGGYWISLKGPNVGDELESARKSINLLGGATPITRQHVLPGIEDGRTIITVTKQKTSPARFPRTPGMPSKQPL